MKDKDVVIAFVEHLREKGYLDLTIESWPDELNRSTKDIDAIAGPLAIEHTQVETLEHQHRDGNFFNRVVKDLVAEYKDRFSFSLRIDFDHNAIRKGQDWNGIREAIRAWVEHNAHTFPEVHRERIELEGVPFPLFVSKHKDLKLSLWFSRRAPEDESLPARIREAAERKVVKLKPYQETGKTTVLLIENNDIALMNVIEMLEACRKAFPRALPTGVDQLWFADTSISGSIYFENFTDRLK